MRREFFVEQMKRLATGFSATLSTERIHALWVKYGNRRETVIESAVTELLTGARYPGRSEIENAIVLAADIENDRQRRRNHENDRASWTPDYDSAPCPPARTRFYTGVMRWFFSQPNWPDWAAIEEWCASATWEDPPDDWRDLIARVLSQNPPGTRPGGLAHVLSPAGKP